MPGKRTYIKMMKTVLDYLKTGKSLTSQDAAEMWKELNVRNQIGRLQDDGWPISGESPEGKKHKVWKLDMDQSKWPKANA